MGAAQNLLVQQGRMYEVGDFENEKRQELGLPKIKMDVESIKKILEVKE